MFRITSVITLALVFLISAADSTFGFDSAGLRPVAPNGIFSTISAESLSRLKYAVEVGGEQSVSPDFSRFLVKGAYGITDSLEFMLMVPYVLQFEDKYDGFEDISIGLKHRFYDQGKYGPSIAYLIHASLDTGREEFSTQGRYGMGLIISKRIGPFEGHANIIYAKAGASRLKDEISLSGGIEFSASHSFSIVGEILAKNSHYTDKYDLIEARLGYRIRTTDSIYTIIGAGLDLENRNPEMRFFVSVSFVAPGEKKPLKRIYEEE